MKRGKKHKLVGPGSILVFNNTGGAVSSTIYTGEKYQVEKVERHEYTEIGSYVIDAYAFNLSDGIKVRVRIYESLPSYHYEDYYEIVNTPILEIL